MRRFLVIPAALLIVACDGGVPIPTAPTVHPVAHVSADLVPAPAIDRPLDSSGVQCPFDSPVFRVDTSGGTATFEWKLVTDAQTYVISIERDGLAVRGHTFDRLDVPVWRWSPGVSGVYRVRMRVISCGVEGQWSAYQTFVIDGHSSGTSGGNNGGDNGGSNNGGNIGSDSDNGGSDKNGGGNNGNGNGGGNGGNGNNGNGNGGANNGNGNNGNGNGGGSDKNGGPSNGNGSGGCKVDLPAQARPDCPPGHGGTPPGRGK